MEKKKEKTMEEKREVVKEVLHDIVEVLTSDAETALELVKKRMIEALEKVKTAEEFQMWSEGVVVAHVKSFGMVEIRE